MLQVYGERGWMDGLVVKYGNIRDVLVNALVLAMSAQIRR